MLGMRLPPSRQSLRSHDQGVNSEQRPLGMGNRFSRPLARYAASVLEAWQGREFRHCFISTKCVTECAALAGENARR
jgi:hypothetical protein